MKFQNNLVLLVLNFNIHFYVLLYWTLLSVATFKRFLGLHLNFVESHMHEELYVIHSHWTGLQIDATKKALSQIPARHKSNSGKTVQIWSAMGLSHLQSLFSKVSRFIHLTFHVHKHNLSYYHASHAMTLHIEPALP